MQTSEQFFQQKKELLGVELNEVQKEAVLSTDGPLLLLASPGSGKTTTIIMRIGYMIEQKRVSPARIKAVTFSRASAKDMEERYTSFFPHLEPVDFSTIHSLAFKIFREYFYKNNQSYQLIEGNDVPQGLHKRIILRNLYYSFHDENITEDQLEELMIYVSFLKNKLIPKDNRSTVKCDVPEALQIFEQYEEQKRTYSNKLLVDYDDMLTFANKLLSQDIEILTKYQRLYDYVLTDESQDTSLVQHKIIEKLVAKHENLCVVADDDQSIYTWRAAEPSYLLNFQHVYPQAKTLFMEQNYRSSKDIVTVANRFIKRNKNRYNKNMFTENPPHEPVQLHKMANYGEQTCHVVQTISSGHTYRDFAILYRNNASSVILIDALDKADIPFYIKDSDLRFFSHWVVRDILNFMRFSYDLSRVDIFERIFSKLGVYISRQQLDHIKGSHKKYTVIDSLLKFSGIDQKHQEKLKRQQEYFRNFHNKSPREVIKTIREDMGYEEVLKKLSKKLGFNFDGLREIIRILEVIAQQSGTMVEFAKRLNHLESLVKQSKDNKHLDAVTLSTLHSSKGLEFEHVFMIDLIRGIIPSESDLEASEKGEKEQIEEAVRLFYVGMTRARRKLELISYHRKFSLHVLSSEFFKDVKRIVNPPQEKDRADKYSFAEESKAKLPKNPNAVKSIGELSPGMEIKHRVFGTGEIMIIDDDIISVQFPTYQKELSISTCLELGLIEPV
ncbi:DNA helicase UvrD [Halalkalibacillus sediminis]|uniref:DNA 3'-5' helicase n=1 Tax=Halalkalibacillus sediminis TaxID=2018042 RepID=A0A2I0QZ44_9BACI|nr:ATP-dependent helicase [Halalkalibacillus sediminis]PKR79400.1 DNA helicase UvrD [Halalkalibacillus sediminis]